MGRPYKRVEYQSSNGFEYPYWDIKTAGVPPSASPTPSVTPSVTTTPSISITPTMTMTPSITPTTTVSSSVTPTPTPTPSTSNNFSVPPTNLYVNNAPLFNLADFNGCYTYNETSYIDIAANPTYRSGANSRDSLSYASYTLNTDATQKIVIITDNTIAAVTGFTFFDIDDTLISGFSDGQSMGTSSTATYAMPQMTQALNGVYFPKAGTFNYFSTTWTLSYGCP